jgi:hypothetical protein
MLQGKRVDVEKWARSVSKTRKVMNTVDQGYPLRLPRYIADRALKETHVRNLAGASR